MPDTLNTYIQKIPNGDKLLMDLGLGQLLRKNTAEIAKWLLNFTNIDLFSVFSKVVNITSGLIQFLLGLFVSIYLLYDKENFSRILKKFMIAIFPDRANKITFKIVKRFDYTLKSYLLAKGIGAIIVGITFYIILL